MPADAALFRRLALSLPGATESAHMGHPDFRVRCTDGKLRIFATLSGDATSRGVLKLTLDQQASFREELPQVFEPVNGGWGRMGMTCVNLQSAEESTLLGALTTAHRNVSAAAAAAKPKPTTARKAAKGGSAKIAPKNSAAQPRIKA